MSTIKNASRILVLDNNRIAEEGSHDELLAKSSLYKRFYEMQFRDIQASK
jgi:ABC-type multidrug transport system fused ATPase/permease subunit